jgi:hypothetical protein
LFVIKQSHDEETEERLKTLITIQLKKATGQKGKDGHIAVNAQAAKQATAKLKPAAIMTARTMAVVFMA